jgi:Fe-S-cluster containining protein
VKCKKCGACCVYLIIEINCLDVVREEKLMVAKAFSHIEGPCGLHMDDFAHKSPCRLLACGPNHPCPMLEEAGTCSIYPTRPNVCVAFRPGSKQCRDSRRAVKKDKT